MASDNCSLAAIGLSVIIESRMLHTTSDVRLRIPESSSDRNSRRKNNAGTTSLYSRACGRVKRYFNAGAAISRVFKAAERVDVGLVGLVASVSAS